MNFEHYIQKGGKTLRYGFTTGSCATLAAKAACEMLLANKTINSISIITPKGFNVEVNLLDITIDENKFVSCAVEKDAGDDPDVTHRALVYAKIEKSSVNGIHIDGGLGIGRVTRPGLDQPIGNAAINSMPRRMIENEVQSICDKYGYDGGLNVIISIPAGVELAKKTFNPQLGIVGGISVLGTSGIVEPQSSQALIDCIEVELKAFEAENIHQVVLTPGNYGENFLSEFKPLENPPTVKCSNFIGDAIDFAVKHSFKQILLIGHIGKFSKLAGGIMNTHSSYADCRVEIIAAHAALCGASKETIFNIMNAVTTDDCISFLDKENLRDDVIKSILGKIYEHISRRAGDNVSIAAIMFSNKYGLLGMTDNAKEIIKSMPTVLASEVL
ncbi:MAG: cobalt-precorrin-5B (C(1))-methyltransferase CbiD [Oscillospiraceae bacterium]